MVLIKRSDLIYRVKELLGQGDQFCICPGKISGGLVFGCSSGDEEKSLM